MEDSGKRYPVKLFGFSITVLSIFLLSFTSTFSQDMDHKHTNHLIHESSPYLLQHAHNPVDWYPWGDEALNKAKEENKLILISIGYAACHWCHVMERESFENELVAAKMNEHFVCIKVDREERPDVDQIYMDAVMLMTGSGGWPLNCFALPDGRPIYGGTYYPQENWLSVLDQLSGLWKNQPLKAEEYAEQLTEGIQSMDAIVLNTEKKPVEREELDAMVKTWSGYFDKKDGGVNRSRNKFPMPNNYQFLLRAAHFTTDEGLSDYVSTTLQKIAFGGIYDHVGGGFARYSTDGQWHVPHFEKMTYDNGQLVSLYAEAYQHDPQQLYKDIVYQTLEYTEREMTSKEGGFYSSLDADSEGEEGKFYVWKQAEINTILGEDAEWYSQYYQVTEKGNWEHGNNVLIHNFTEAELAAQKGWSIGDFRTKLATANEKLLAERSKRIRPGLDDKILTSWNAIMLKGYVDAYRVFGEKSFLETAIRNAEFLDKNMREGNRLNRNYKNGKSSINAFLDDYALLADAYLALFQVTQNKKWLDAAEDLTEYAVAHFFDANSGMFFYTSDEDPALIARKFETTDNVIPGSNSVMANNLFALSHLLDRSDYEKKAEQMLANVKKDFVKYPSGYSNWGLLMLKELFPYYEIVIAGPKAGSLALKLRSHYLPNALLVAAQKESDLSIPLLENRFLKKETRIFVCQNKVCQLPVETVEEALAQLK